MRGTTMQCWKRWAGRLAVLALGFGLAIGLIWKSVGAQGAHENGTQMARLERAADIIEIYNLESHYANALDSGRLGEVADLWTPTGGFGFYYEDPVTTHLVNMGQPVTSYKDEIVTSASDNAVDKGAPLKDFPHGCLIFGRENLRHFFREGGNSIRPHVDGWPGAPNGGGEYPGTRVSRHVIIDKYVELHGDTATLHEYYGAGKNSVIAEVDLVRTPEGWRFQFRKVITPNKPKGPGIPCMIADPKFPLPHAGSLGGVPNFATPN